MTIRRYSTADIIGKRFRTSTVCLRIRQNIDNGSIQYTTYITKENERLDILAGIYYGDGRLWWIIAAASQIGFGLQMPSNTKLFIPKLEDAVRFIG